MDLDRLVFGINRMLRGWGQSLSYTVGIRAGPMSVLVLSGST